MPRPTKNLAHQGASTHESEPLLEADQQSSTLAPASCSFSTLITCSSLNRLCFMGLPPRRSKGGRFQLAMARISGRRSGSRQTPCLIHQPSYSILNRWVERDGLLDTLDDLGIGSIVFSPLAQGLLMGKYLDRIPEGRRAAQGDFSMQG